jgi:pepF/M3 family oligoendopeptidase
MSVVYPSLDSVEFEQDFQALLDEIGALTALFERHGVGKREPAPLDAPTVAAFEEVTSTLNAMVDHARVVQAYIYSFVSTNSRDNAAQARLSVFQQEGVKLSQLSTRFVAWIGGLDVEELIGRSTLAAEHAFMLRRAKQQSEHLMSPVEEALAAELNLSGALAWGQLHSNLTSQLSVTIEINGEERQMPMSATRNLASSPDRELRRRAYEAEIAAWQQAALPLAAALNSIKGQVGTLARRRGWASPLDAALFDNNIDRATLDAMLTAARESFPDFRRYLRAKARLLGIERLAWYDLFAPVGAAERSWSYDAAADFIIAQFGKYSDRMSRFAARAFEEQWIDAEPRSGKVDGAFCMRLRHDESRILANFTPTVKSVLTLAHELGHAYHNLNLAQRTILNQDTPMTLAETASIFCETIVRRAALAEASAAEQLEILEASLVGATQVVVDIISRFEFESAVFDGRQRRALSIDELNAAMLDSQRSTYGDALDPQALHPYMWAAKGHYYSGGRSFYNYPYMFGLLFGLGLYAIYLRDQAAFRTRYDDLLSSTGLADAATLAAQMGIDIRSPDFWRASLAIIREDIDRFEALAGGVED